MWVACWKIFVNCLWMLDAVGLGKLTTYKRRQDKYHEEYGEEIWALQYQADGTIFLRRDLGFAKRTP